MKKMRGPIGIFAVALAIAGAAGCAADPSYDDLDGGQPPIDGGPTIMDANNPV